MCAAPPTLPRQNSYFFFGEDMCVALSFGEEVMREAHVKSKASQHGTKIQKCGDLNSGLGLLYRGFILRCIKARAGLLGLENWSNGTISPSNTFETTRGLHETIETGGIETGK